MVQLKSVMQINSWRPAGRIPYVLFKLDDLLVVS